MTPRTRAPLIYTCGMKLKLAAVACWMIVPSMVFAEAPLAPAYRASLQSPGGALEFGLRFEGEGPTLAARVTNGPESISIPVVSRRDDALTLSFDYYDSVIEATLSADGRSIEGAWKKRRSLDDWSVMVFRAVADDQPRPAEAFENREGPLVGRWRAAFAGEEDEAVAVITSGGPSTALGTFLTTTGDYRFLAGSTAEQSLTLSCFDGAHAFLFKAALQPDGTLKGDFWSGASFHTTWTARRDEQAALPDPFGLTTFTGSASALDALSYPDATGTPRSMKEFAGSPRVIEIFGTWCPNCRDATELMVELERAYGPRGLRVVGLAFELTGDPRRDREQVALYAERHEVRHPILIGGTRDKSLAAKAFPVLDKLRAYPTFIFIDGSNTVRGVYTGFSGPATGEEHERLRRAFIERIESMLPR